ncbi:MAG: hypothetical protein ABMA13_22930 [Chthoniobacteraceae bacterium]
MEPTQLRKTPTITPLWIIAGFLSLTEVTLGYATTQVTGAVQWALAIFVMTFAILVLIAFFVILWNRPWVFYAPSEYGNIHPKDFMAAFPSAPAIAGQVELVRSVEKNPNDLEARFSLIDLMADDAQIQWIIFMHETGKEISGWTAHVYEYASGGAGSGTFSFGRNKLEGTGLVRQSGGRHIALTDEGHRFAEWLVAKGRKASFFWCEYGTWGTPSPRSQEWVKNQQVQFAAQNSPAPPPPANA